MKPRATTRALLALAMVFAVLMIPATAWAGCNVSVTPNPTWRGGTISILGNGFPANAAYYVNLNGDKIREGTTSGSGTINTSYQIPGSFPTGSANWFVQDTLLSTCAVNGDLQVNSGPPATTTTTAATTTTTTTTTTTLPPTTTVAPTTTLADTTTTVVDTTTTTVSDTTTTTVAEADDGGGIPIFIWIVIAVLGGAVLFLIGKMSSRRK